jgi:hypothetical protein
VGSIPSAGTIFHPLPYAVFRAGKSRVQLNFLEERKHTPLNKPITSGLPVILPELAAGAMIASYKPNLSGDY